MTVRSSLLIIALATVLTSILIADSSLEAIIMLAGGVAGIIGIATWGYSSKEVAQIVKSKF